MRIMRVYKKWSMHGVGLLKITALLVSILMITYLYNLVDNVRYPSQTEMLVEIEELLRSLVAQEKGTGCKVPDLDPFSLEATRFDVDIPTILCDGDDWVECQFSKCYVKKQILDRMTDVQCTYKDIVYVDDSDFYLGKSVMVVGDGEYKLKISDFVKVSCTGTEVKGIRTVSSKWHGRKAGLRPIASIKPKHKLNTSLNVFLLIFDSISRNSFTRRMPISYKVLRDELSAVVMNGHNIVGCGTDGALWPILTGKNDMEVPDSRKIPTNKRHVDPESFVFTLLKEQYRYRTAYLEDLGFENTFNSRYNGFAHMPTDHYLRHLSKEMGGILATNLFCFGSESHFKFMVDYSSQLFKTRGKKFCVTIIASYSHDSLNYMPLADKELAPFLRKFKNEGHLEDTLLFVMADHGSRQTGIRNTYQGKIEEHLPFVSIILPAKLKESRPEALTNLIANSKVLTTHYDIHTTLLDALGLEDHRNKYRVPGADFDRGMSLLEPIPASRACAEAGIVPHLCACAHWQNVSMNDDVYSMAAQELARFVNEVTAKTDKCAKRNLLSIEWVYRLGPKPDLFGFTTKPTILDKFFAGRHRRRFHFRKITAKPTQEYYQAKITMDPGKAIFEGTMKFNRRDASFSVSNRDVSRVNKYGDEPKCIIGTHPHLAQYCYCVDKILTDRKGVVGITQHMEILRQ